MTVTISFQGVPQWAEQGPASILDVNGKISGTGAIVDVARHPLDESVIFAATSGGGIWRTRDAGADNLSPAWEPLTDRYPSPAMGSIAFDPSDSQHLTLYAGTGSFASFGPSGPAVGLYKTVDGGETWRVVGTSDLAGRLIRSVLPLAQPNVVLVGAISNLSGGGVFRSVDGGTSFSPVSGGQSSGLPAGDGLSLIEDPAQAGRIYAAIGGSSAGVYRSDNAGETWSPVSTGIATADLATVQWIRLAVRPGGSASTLYAGIVAQGWKFVGLYQANAQPGQESWASIDFPAGGGDAIYPGDQAWKFALVADPSGPALIVAADQGGVWRADLSNSTEPAWQQINAKEKGDNVPEGAPHADCQALLFDAGGHLLAANDGGIYRLVNPGGADRKWVFIGGAIRNDEPLGVAYDTLARVATVGSADNGCSYQRGIGDHTWLSVAGGDGGDQGVDNSAASFSYRYQVGVETTSLASFARQKFNESNRPQGDAESVRLAGMPDADKAESAGFTMNNLPEEGARLLVGGTRLFESVDGGATVTLVLDLAANRPAAPFRIAYGSAEDGSPAPDATYIGVGNQLWLRTPGQSSFQQVTAYPGGSIAHVAVDLFDWKRACVIDNTDVYRTPDGGMSWTPCTGDLLRVVTDAQGGSQLQRVLVYRHEAGTDEEAVLVGASGGVFRTLNASDGAGATWAKFGRNVPNCFIQELKYYPPRERGHTPTGDVLVASVYGRGAWVLEHASTELPRQPILVIEGNTGRDTIRLALSQTVPGLLEVYDTPDGGPPRAVAPLTSVQQIVVRCRGDEDTLILDCGHGLIDVPGGIEYRAVSGTRNALVIKGGAAAVHTHRLGAESGAVTAGAMHVTYQGIQRIDDSIRAKRLPIELEPGLDELELSNGPDFGRTQSLRVRARHAGGQVDLNLTNQEAVALDLAKGVGRVTVDDFRRPPTRLRLLTLASGPRHDDFRIATTPAGVVTRIEGGGGSDNVTVGSLTGSSGRTTDVRGEIHVSNHGGKTLLSVASDENADPADGVLSLQSLTGLSPAQIGFVPSELSGLTILLSGGTTLTVEHTPMPTTVLGGTNLTTLRVLGTEASLEYAAGQGVDAVQIGQGSVDAVRGPVLIRGSARGNVNVTVDDSATTTERTVVVSDRGISGLAPAEITLVAGANPARNGLTIKSGHARGFYSVVDTPPLFAVGILGQGLDVVNIAGVHQPFEVEGATGVSLGGSAVGLANIRDAVTIGPGGPTTVTIDDRGSTTPKQATVADHAVTGLTPREISYANAALRTLHVLGGSGGNRVKVTGTRTGITTSLSLGDGPDVISVCATSGPLVLDAHRGATQRIVVGSTAPEDTKAELETIAGEVKLSAVAGNVDLIIGDGGGHVARSGELNQNGSPDLGPAPITWGPLHSLSVRLSRLGNSLLVTGSPAGGGATTIWTGGHDKLEAKPSEEIPCDLFVNGSKPSEDALRVLLEDRSASVDVIEPAGTEPATIRITYRSGTTKLIRYRDIGTVIPPRAL